MSLGLPSAEEVALEMGDMLARIHWRAGFDARDVEFVMGDDMASSVAFYVIDFNQAGFPSLFYRLNNSLDKKMGVIEGIPTFVNVLS